LHYLIIANEGGKSNLYLTISGYLRKIIWFFDFFGGFTMENCANLYRLFSFQLFKAAKLNCRLLRFDWLDENEPIKGFLANGGLYIPGVKIHQKFDQIDDQKKQRLKNVLEKKFKVEKFPSTKQLSIKVGDRRWTVELEFAEDFLAARFVDNVKIDVGNGLSEAEKAQKVFNL